VDAFTLVRSLVDAMRFRDDPPLFPALTGNDQRAALKISDEVLKTSSIYLGWKRSINVNFWHWLNHYWGIFR